jgi:hypothetical protein
MKNQYKTNLIQGPGIIKTGILLAIFLHFGLGAYAQNSRALKVSNDQQLMQAVENPAVRSFVFEPGYYPSTGRYLGPGITAKKSDNGNRSANCIYAIQESSTCFAPVPPATYVCDMARAMTFDNQNCGCCPPNDAGVWSQVSGPGTVIFSDPTEDSTEFCVDTPGIYTLRYSWSAPWNSYVQTEYYFYTPFITDLQADDTCGLSTTVHFEYTSALGDPNATLEWTLNGDPYAGPSIDPHGDTLDFLLTVPSCGEYVLQATLNSESCGEVAVSDTIFLKGDSYPEITGVGTDTTTICPDISEFSVPSVSDVCDPDPEMTFTTDSIPGDCEQSYTLIRIWTAVNWCGNTTADTQVIVHEPNPNPEIIPNKAIMIGDTIFAVCDEQVIIPFPEITTTCGPAEVFYDRSDGGVWGDPFGNGTTTEVCYWGISPCGYSTDTTCFLVIVEQCETEGEQYCSLTQGYYGNPGGTFCNGMGTAELIDSLLGLGNLVVGYNANTMAFFANQSGCIIDLLPGGGPAKKITGANTCANHPGIQMKNGRINNILLAQTITLGLNLRLDDELGGLEMLSDTLVTAPSSGCDEEGDTVTGPTSKFIIPMSVYNVLSQNGTIIPTVADLYLLANKGLGGVNVGATTLQAISDAVSRINEGFDECRIGAFQLTVPLQSYAIPGSGKQTGDESPIDLKIFPNPFSSTANIAFTASENGHASVEVYDLTGRKVAVLYEGSVESGRSYQYTFSGDPGLDQVTYICVIRTDYGTRIERMVMVR